MFRYPTDQQRNRVKTERYSKELVVFKDSYRRVSEEEFHELNRKLKESGKTKYLPSCEKELFTCTKEKLPFFYGRMNRSVKAAIKNWVE